MLLDGEAIPETNVHGERVRGDTLLILLSADAGPVAFILPARGGGWSTTTNDPKGLRLMSKPGGSIDAGSTLREITADHRLA